MVVELMRYLAAYLAVKFPGIPVVRAYELFTEIMALAETSGGGKRIFVVPQRSNGTDAVLTRGTAVQRDIGVTVAFAAKTDSWALDVCDPLLNEAEAIRESLWATPQLQFNAPGYGPGALIRVDDALSGVPTEARMFTALFIPRYRVTHRLVQ